MIATVCITCPECGHRISPKRSEIVRFGRIEAHMATHEVFVDGEKRKLGRKAGHRSGAGKAFLMLAAMLKAPEEVFSREALVNLTDTWECDPKIVNVYLSHLRTALNDVIEIRNYHNQGWAIHERKLAKAA